MQKITGGLILVTFFFLALASISAQTTYGLKLGFNHSNIKQTSDLALFDEFTPIGYLQVGMLANFPLSNEFSIQPELLLSQRGGQNQLNFDTINSEVIKHKYTYVSLPVILGYKLGKLSIEFGPEFAYQLDSKIVVDGIEAQNLVFLNKNKFELSVDIGVKYSIHKLFTQVRWQRSLSPLWSIPVTDINGEPTESATAYSSSLQFSIGYAL